MHYIDYLLYLLIISILKKQKTLGQLLNFLSYILQNQIISLKIKKFK